MICVGNDIVDLRAIDIQRTRTPRFYSKFISPAELTLYTGELETIPFEHFVWLLWSVKEAAYKCLQRHQPDLVFSPIKIQVIDITAVVGVVTNGMQVHQYPTHKLLVTTPTTATSTIQLFAQSGVYTEELIHTIVCLEDDFSDVCSDFRRIEHTDPESQSAVVRELLLNTLSVKYPGRALSIEKDVSGIPNVFIDGRMRDMPISLAHHGNWVGYAYQIL